MNSDTIYGNGAYPFETWSMPQPVATHTISAEPPTSTDWHPQRNHHQRDEHIARRFYTNGSSFPRPALPNLPPPYAQQLYNVSHAHDVVGGPVDDASPSAALANITNVMHVADVTESTTSAQPDRAGNAGRRTIRKDLDWEGNKLRIKKMYIDDNKTLDDTMRQMDEQFGFVASKKLYKTKFDEWNWSKYLSGKTSQWIVEHNEKRKRADKETTYKLGEQKLSMGSIRRKAARHEKRSRHAPEDMVVDASTPAEISYETPQACETLPFHTLPRNSTVPTDIDGETETSRQYSGYAWDDEPKSFFDSIILDARRLESENEGFQALTKYRNALVGYRNLLPHTHPQLSSLEYELANLHMQLHQTKEAYELLNWMSKVHARDLGPRHLKTVQHLNHVIGLLRVWSRQNDAQPLVQYLLQDQDSPSETIPYLTFSPTPNSEPAGLALTAGPLVTDASLETFVLSLDERFKDRPVEISEKALCGWSKLIRICVAQNDEARTKLAMTRAADSVRTVMQLKNPTWTMGLFRCVLDLMQLFIKEGDFTTARETLEDVEAKLEGVLGNDYCNRLSILTGIALLYQNENRWSDAVAYLEHAQAVSARAYGRKNSRTRWIEDARRKGFYKPMPPVFPSL